MILQDCFLKSDNHVCAVLNKNLELFFCSLKFQCMVVYKLGCRNHCVVFLLRFLSFFFLNKHKPRNFFHSVVLKMPKGFMNFPVFWRSEDSVALSIMHGSYKFN